ncbi:MAG: hydroxymethylbilane synthase, partial [Gammaproteobacteria bacterium RIFCSPHIGHO2_12_FULL_45_12]
QIQALRQDVQLRDLRGNIHTRLKRLDDGDFSAIILAAAGLKRMGLTQRIRAYLSIEECLPSAGQGALGIECRTDDVATQKLIGELNHLPTFQCVSAERQVCRQLEGGCQTPLAAYAVIHQGVLSLQALIASQKGVRILRARHQGAPWQAEAIGSLVAEQLIQQGAKKWLQAFHAE